MDLFEFIVLVLVIILGGIYFFLYVKINQNHEEKMNKEILSHSHKKIRAIAEIYKMKNRRNSFKILKWITDIFLSSLILLFKI